MKFFLMFPLTGIGLSFHASITTVMMTSSLLRLLLGMKEMRRGEEGRGGRGDGGERRAEEGECRGEC